LEVSKLHRKGTRQFVEEIVDMTSTLEERITRSLRSLVEGLEDGAAIDRDSQDMRELLDGLEWWLPTILAEVYSFWQGEGLDGIYLAFARKTGPDEAELGGACILISDQTLTPIHLRLQIARDQDDISWLECRVGDAGTGKGGMRRTPYSSEGDTKEIYAVVDRPNSIQWVYKVTFGQRRFKTDSSNT
jgi:hypothetical protein